MQKYFEKRNEYNIACYIVDVTPAMRMTALDFAEKIILSDNQFSRLLPSNMRSSGDLELRQKIEIQRTYVGKLGELAFAQYLNEKGKTPDTCGMFEIYSGQSNVDQFDFRTRSGKSVDVKTGFRANHTRLLINTEQFDNNPKDYYVGVKLNARDTDSNSNLVDWDGISSATVLGYAEYDFLKEHADIKNFGEGDARCREYNKLLAIDRLEQEF